MVKHIEQWQCELCERLHASPALAEACEAVGFYDKVEGVEVGSIVVCPYFSYGWHDAKDTCWVRNNPMAGTDTHRHLYNPLFVVTAIHRKEEQHSHQTTYSLLCPVAPNGQPWHRWNCQSTHYKMELITEPSEGIKEWMAENFEKWRDKIARELL